MSQKSLTIDEFVGISIESTSFPIILTNIFARIIGLLLRQISSGQC